MFREAAILLLLLVASPWLFGFHGTVIVAVLLLCSVAITCAGIIAGKI